MLRPLSVRKRAKSYLFSNPFTIEIVLNKDNEIFEIIALSTKKR